MAGTKAGAVRYSARLAAKRLPIYMPCLEAYIEACFELRNVPCKTKVYGFHFLKLSLHGPLCS